MASKSRAGEDSDSDGEPTSFFSHLETTTAPESVAQPPSDPAPVVCDSSNYSNSSGSGTVMYDAAPSAPKPFSIRDEGGVAYDFPESVLSGEWGQEEVTPDVPSGTRGPEQEVGPLLGAGPGLSMDDQAVCCVAQYEAYNFIVTLFQYRRFIGGKRKKGRDPSLNDLIEIKEDDVKVEIENYRRHNSDDTVDKLYKPVSV